MSKRKVLTLEKKIEVIKLLEKGNENEVKTCDENVIDWDAPATELVNILDTTADSQDSQDDDDNSDNNETDDDFVTSVEALVYADKIKKLAMNTGRHSLLDKIMEVESDLLDMRANEGRQSSISDFFKPV